MQRPGNLPRYQVVRQRPRRWLIASLAVGWVLSVAAAWAAASWVAAPELPGLRGELESTREQLHAASGELEQLRQSQAVLARSDQVSREANRAIQQDLADREEEIARLRSDLAFYEKIASGAARKGLGVHTAEFMREPAGSWRYDIVLTQNLERAATSQGKLRFAIEGVRDGRLESLDWDTLHQREDAPAQPYAFRYFQRLQGSVMLPDGFKPQRVRVLLHGPDARLEQAVAWTQPQSQGDA